MQLSYVASIIAGCFRCYRRTIESRCILLKVLLATLVVAIATNSNANWTITNLHPAGFAESIAFATHSGQQVGEVDIGGNFANRASLWTGTAESWIDLHPSVATRSTARGSYAGQQVGASLVNGRNRASLWSGTAESWVNLHPVGVNALNSFAYAIHAGQQVGWVDLQASLWSGSADSWVSLHPDGAFRSWANGVHAGRQAGYADLGGVRRAGLWSGTAESWVDLHPAAASGSEAYDIFGDQQVGEAIINGNQHASLWRGTAESWVNLHPAGATRSTAYAVYDGIQVGVAQFGAQYRAGLWRGTADSWVNLAVGLPPPLLDTRANSIWVDGTTIFIAGWGQNTSTNRLEALLWTIPIPEPGSPALVICGLFGTLFRRRRRHPGDQ